MSTASANTSTKYAAGGNAVITLASATATAATWNAAYHFVLANSQTLNSATGAATNTLCSMSKGLYGGTTTTNPYQDVTSTDATSTNAYCLATPSGAGTAAFAVVEATSAGTLSLVPGSSLTPTNFPTVTSNDPDTCYNSLVASSPFTAVANTVT